jgi:hypothetical protein
VKNKRPRAEQSNTSILAGDAILKAFAGWKTASILKWKRELS